MLAIDASEASWFKSSYSGTGGNCVEAAHSPGLHAIRDSKHPDTGHLTLTPKEWNAFLTTVKHNHL